MFNAFTVHNNLNNPISIWDSRLVIDYITVSLDSERQLRRAVRALHHSTHIGGWKKKKRQGTFFPQ
jgi:hypothetical protein